MYHEPWEAPVLPRPPACFWPECLFRQQLLPHTVWRRPSPSPQRSPASFFLYHRGFQELGWQPGGLRAAQIVLVEGGAVSQLCDAVCVWWGEGVSDHHGILSEVQDVPLQKVRARIPRPWAAPLQDGAGCLCVP